PIQHVLLGLSAHINYDLPIGIARTIVELGAAGDPARLRRFRHDHDAVNHLLRASVPEAFDRLTGRHACPASRMVLARAYGLAEWVAMEILTTWRTHVWDDALELLRAKTQPAWQRVVSGLVSFSLPEHWVLALP